ncbi:MAG: glycosyltransferase family 4 protein [Cellvibrionaceae bacterium]
MSPTVVFMNTHKGWGGGEKWHFEAACFFHALGYDVTFICKKDSILHERLLEKGINCLFFKVTNLSFLNPFKILHLSFLLKEKEILFINSPADNKLAGVSSLFNPLLNIIFRRGMPHPIKSSFLNRWLFRSRIACVIANSETVKESLNSRYKNLIAKENIKVIYNGFDIEAYNKKSFSLFSQVSDVLIFVSCGRLVEQKNQLLLLKASKYLKDKGKNFQLIIVGEGPLDKGLKQYVESNELEDFCIFSGFLDNIKDALSCADVFLLPSLYEGSSNALIEACGAGLPAIVSDISSNKEIVANDVNGYVLPIDEPEQWGEAMLRLMNDRQKLSAFGLCSKKKIESDFSIKKSREQLKQLVDNLCEN